MKKLSVVVLFLLFVSVVAGIPFLNQSLSETFEIEEYEAQGNQTSEKIVQDGRLNLPSGIVLLAIAALGIFLYAFEIDPFWMVLLIFYGALTGTVTYFNLPAIILPVAVVISIAGVYFK